MSKEKWVAIIQETIDDEDGSYTVETVIGPFATWEEASRVGHRFPFSVISPLESPADHGIDDGPTPLVYLDWGTLPS